MIGLRDGNSSGTKGFTGALFDADARRDGNRASIGVPATFTLFVEESITGAERNAETKYIRDEEEEARRRPRPT